MNLLLWFPPLIAFALVTHVAGTALGLAAGALAAVALLLPDALTGRHAKLLEIGASTLFGGLAFCDQPDQSLAHVHKLVNCGLFRKLSLENSDFPHQIAGKPN